MTVALTPRDLHDAIIYAEDLLGEELISNKLLELARLEKHATGLAYREWFLTPQYALWLAIRDIRQYRQAGAKVEDIIDQLQPKAIEIFIMIKLVGSSMPDWRRKSLAQDLAAAEEVNDVLVELTVAQKFLEHGCSIEWLEEVGKDGERSAEYLITYGEFTFAVECKNLRHDTGRSIDRPQICQLIDLICDTIRHHKECGEVYVNVKGKIDKSVDELERISKEIHCPSDQFPKDIIDATTNIHQAQGDTFDIDKYAEKISSPYPYVSHTFVSSRDDNELLDPLAVVISLETQNKFIDTLKKRVRSAAEQLKSSAGIGMIALKVPDIPDFSAPEVFQVMSGFKTWLFGNEERGHIFCVFLESEPLILDNAQYSMSTNPYCVLINPSYESYPPVKLLTK
jgi:hypothetical protein